MCSEKAFGIAGLGTWRGCQGGWKGGLGVHRGTEERAERLVLIRVIHTDTTVSSESSENAVWLQVAQHVAEAKERG